MPFDVLQPVASVRYCRSIDRVRRAASGSWRRWLALRAAGAAILVTSLSVSSLCAADGNAEFTAALRERGWDDTAVEFLEWVEKSPLATPEFQKQLPYERALSLAAQARQTRNRAEHDRLLSQAAADFHEFAKANPASPSAIDALRQSANVRAEQALSTLAESRQLPEQATAQRDEARKKARQEFEQAAASAEQIVDQCTQELAALPKATAIQADAEAKARRDQLRDRQVEARFLLARISFEQAAAYEPTSVEFKEMLDLASQRFGELVEEYRESLVGASSRFYQGRCAQELGAHDKALGCFDDLVKAPTANPEFRRWAARAHRHLAESLIALDKLDEAIKDSEEWLTASKPAERQQPEWLEVAFGLAGAYQEKMKDESLNDGESKRLQSNARNLMREISQHPNEFQQEARLSLASLGQRSGSGETPKTFADAFAAGKTALEVWNSSTLAAKLALENNPEAVEELQQQADENRNESLRMLELSLALADSQTALEQLNTVRYYLCILYWEDKRIHEAAVLAEFLASRYPENEFAASAAKVALAAYEQLAIESRGANGGGTAAAGATSYEARKLAALAELMAARWPETPEAASAVNVLIQTALREDRLADAESLLARLPVESRSAAELSLGAGLWTQYLRATAGQRDAPSDATIALRDKAGSLLTKGFAGLREKGRPNASAAVGTLYLVQYLLANGDAMGALDVLENEKAGPLALVESESEVAARPEFVLETYKAALRAYLSAEPPQRDKAEAMMAALDDFVAAEGGDKGAQQLTDVYLSLGVQLQRQLKELTAAGQEAKAQQVAAAFGALLERVAARPDAESWRIRSWLAQTNLQLGQALTGDESKAYVNRAKQTYDAMLAAVAKDASYAPDPNAVLAVRMRLGECLAATGDHQRAVEQYGAILRERPNMLDLQQAAATALQQWGVDKRDPASLDRAIRGDLPQKDGKNLIWGWLRLATMANAAKAQAAKITPATPETKERADRFESLFFEARFNVAKSRYLAALASPPEARAEQLQGAKSNIAQMATLYPELGGPQWKAAFDELLKQINQELAKK